MWATIRMYLWGIRHMHSVWVTDNNDMTVTCMNCGNVFRWKK